MCGWWIYREKGKKYERKHAFQKQWSSEENELSKMVHKNETMRFLSSLINKGMWFLPLSSHQTDFPCTLNGEFSHPTKGSSSLADILRYHLATKKKKKSTFLISMFPFRYVESSKRKMGEDFLASKISWNKSNGATTSKRFFIIFYSYTLKERT